MPKIIHILLAISIALVPAVWARAVEVLSLPATFDLTQPKVPGDRQVARPEGTSVTAKEKFPIFEYAADRHTGVKHKAQVEVVTFTARIHDTTTVYLV